MAPSSYQAPMRGDKADEATYSQTKGSNLSQSRATVSTLLETKGRDVVTVRPTGTIGTVVEVLRDKRIGAVIVCDDERNILGILSERDIVRRMADTPGQTLPQLVSDLMTQDVQTCGPDEALITVLQRMNEGRFRHLPVLGELGLCGIITIGDVVDFRLKELEYEALQMKQMIVG